MTDFEKKMHHDGRLYGWAMLIAICAFPFFASVRSVLEYGRILK